MKRIGIVTLDGNFNYGNRLQNYAMERVIESLDFESETIIVPRKNPNSSEKISVRIKSLIKKLIKKQSSWNQMVATKEPIFAPFTERYIHNRKIYEGINQDFSFFIVGSDQVWNPNIVGENPFYFLDFADKKKRISYAASFGISKIPEEMCPFYKKMLSEMKTISVREETGKEIVDTLTDKNATVVVDPTMLLSANDWNLLIDSETIQDKRKCKYVLLYLLRGITEESYRAIKNYAKAHSLEIIEVMGDQFSSKLKVYSPVEFIEKIKNAHMVFSDSFHCGVFSIIFHTPFVMFDRSEGNMGSRIDTLLNIFNLENNKYQKNIDFDNVFKTDFSAVDDKLSVKRTEGLTFLKNALKEDNE